MHRAQPKSAPCGRALLPRALMVVALLSLPALAEAAEGAPACVVRPWGETAPLRTTGFASVPGAGRPALAPVSPLGSLHMLVILAEFADIPARAPVARFQGLLYGGKPSVRDYYDEVSGGRLDLSGDLFGWVTLPETELFYSQGSFGVGTYPNNGQNMAEDAVSAALAAYPALDLGTYDGDGDGNVDVLLVIHSGQGYEWAGSAGATPSPDPNAINSHKWVTVQRDFGSGASVLDYYTCPELQLVRPIIAPAWTDSVATIGVYCHELGHMFGLPDYYDTETLGNHVSTWDIMDFGTWNRVKSVPAWAVPGALPGHFSAWSKMFLGWTAPQIVAPPVGESVREQRTLASASLGGTPLQLLVNPLGVDWAQSATGTGEYFLAEVRTQDGYDAGLPAEGLLLYHVDESRPGNDASKNEDGGALLRVLVQDGSTADSTLATDPWPGTQSAFGPLSDPSSRFWSGIESGVALPVIGPVSGTSVSLTIDVTNLAAGAPLPFARPNPFSPSVHGAAGLVFAVGGSAAGTGVGIYDVQGRLVRKLGPPELDPASGAAVWDGRRDDGRPAVAGIYFFRLEGGASGSSGRVALVR